MAGKVESNKFPLKEIGFWTIFTLIFSLTVLFSGCVNQPQSITFADNVSPEQKKVELKKRLDRRYEDAPTHFLLAQLYHAERSFDDAEFYYNNSLRFDPVYKPAQAGMVKLFLDRGDKLKAQHYLENYMNQVGENPSRIVELARELQEQGLDDYALNCFQKALDLAPKSAEVNKYLGYFYLSKNDNDKARQYFQASFEIDSTQYDVSRELGRLEVPVEYEGPVPKELAGEK